MNTTSKRILAIGLPLALVAATGVSIAYWTGGGTVTGSATTASGVAALELAQVAAPTGMAPGIAAGAVSVEVTNPAGSGAAVKVSKVVASITEVTAVGGGTCSAADYTLTGAEMTTGAAELAPGDSTTFTGASLGFNNTTSDQDGCKGATVTLSYTAS